MIREKVWTSAERLETTKADGNCWKELETGGQKNRIRTGKVTVICWHSWAETKGVGNVQLH